MRKVMSILAAAGIAAGLFASATATASAQSGQRYPRVAPENCGAVASRLGPGQTWQAMFWGQKQDDFGHWEEIFVAPCFSSHAKCFAWLYWAQSDWPDHQPPGRCRTGLPY
jgi:hypothetical protein